MAKSKLNSDESIFIVTISILWKVLGRILLVEIVHGIFRPTKCGAWTYSHDNLIAPETISHMDLFPHYISSISWSSYSIHICTCITFVFQFERYSLNSNNIIMASRKVNCEGVVSQVNKSHLNTPSSLLLRSPIFTVMWYVKHIGHFEQLLLRQIWKHGKWQITKNEEEQQHIIALFLMVIVH